MPRDHILELFNANLVLQKYRKTIDVRQSYSLKGDIPTLKWLNATVQYGRFSI